MRAPLPPIRFGILGTGRITRKMGPAIARTAAAQLAAVASRDGARAAAWGKEFGADRSYGSYESLLDDPDLDAVYVALPAGLHREWTINAAERGLHVLCEKPLAGTLADAAEMVAACRQHDVQLMDGVMWIHTPRAAAMRAVIESGRIGDLRRVTSAFTVHPDNWTATEPRLDPRLGGGCLLDLGWYCVGVSLWAFATGDGGAGDGERREMTRSKASLAPPPLPIPRLPDHVWATAECRNGVDVAFSAVLDFGGGRIASFDCGFETAKRTWVEIAATEGSLVCDDFTRPCRPEKTRFWLHDRWAASAEHRCEPSEQEQDLVAAFCRPVVAGRPDHSWAEASLKVQRVCDALMDSARTGEAIRLPAGLP